MAYIALYRKWRPKGFEDVVGQSHITETLQKAIETDKVAHAYLFRPSRDRENEYGQDFCPGHELRSRTDGPSLQCL